MRLPIYDDVSRTDTSPKRENEGTAKFFNRIAGTFWDAVRCEVQRWADRLPDEAYASISSRLNSRSDDEHHSAFLELYTHALLDRAGYAIDIEPALSNSPRRPDFLAARDQEAHYVECRRTGNRNPAAMARQNRFGDVLDSLQRVDSPNHVLSILVAAEGPHPLAVRRLRQQLEAWLASLDPDSALSYASLPSFPWSQEGWRFEFHAIPRSSESRGGSRARPLGVFQRADDRHAFDDASTMREALTAKANAYGPLNHPYTVALGTATFGNEGRPILEALYGGEGIGRPPGAAEPIVVRLRNGFFGGPPQWANASVASVLHIDNSAPQFIARTVPTLWVHPATPVDSVPKLPTARVVTFAKGSLSEQPPTLTPGEFFGLPLNWPPGDAFP